MATHTLNEVFEAVLATQGVILRGFADIQHLLETSRKAPKCASARKGLHGRQTRAMVEQRRVFAEFLKAHPETHEYSRNARACQCWRLHADWQAIRHATGEAKGYSSFKALAGAR